MFEIVSLLSDVIGCAEDASKLGMEIKVPLATSQVPSAEASSAGTLLLVDVLRSDRRMVQEVKYVDNSNSSFYQSYYST